MDLYIISQSDNGNVKWCSFDLFLNKRLLQLDKLSTWKYLMEYISVVEFYLS